MKTWGLIGLSVGVVASLAMADGGGVPASVPTAVSVAEASASAHE